MAAHLADCNYDLSPLNHPPIITDAKDGCLEWSGSFGQVLIYGAGLGKRNAPLNDPTWTVWALNTIPPIDSEGKLRCDCWWDVHPHRAQSANDLRWIKKCPVPIIVLRDSMSMSTRAVALPIERLQQAFPEAPWACTFAYQIAFALLEGFTKIGLYGVELAYGTPRERTVEWASVNWWIGFAEGNGIEVIRPKNSRLGRHPYLYGFDYETEMNETKRYLRTVKGQLDSSANKQTKDRSKA